ncbi:hypothetical protein [Methylomonas fluvii]|nr:hypothetical protein [Methylomonas fluvii]CAD6876515.1 Cysteine synthase (EC 2.5.1.47) [Methylomonas fluvii]
MDFDVIAVALVETPAISGGVRTAQMGVGKTVVTIVHDTGERYLNMS